MISIGFDAFLSLNVVYRKFGSWLKLLVLSASKSLRRCWQAAWMRAEGRDFDRIRCLLVPERRLSKVLKPAETAGVVGLKIAETLATGRMDAGRGP
ncbi:hypothetical protein [Raoultella terrigena]|uniref:hypothetical protein n=1 Tax=Raoultella terrigena TaxID=577 RepID=UPI0030E06891